MKSLPFLFLSAAFLPSAALAAGDQPYEFTDLGDLGGGESVAYGMNDQRQVVGWSTIPGCMTANGAPCRRAYMWQNGVMTDLGKLPADEESFARAINNAGQIVGTSESDILFGSGTFHGVSWMGGVLSQLPDLGMGTSFAHDVNEVGQIAGHSVSSTSIKDHAVIWSGGAISDIGATQGHSYNRGYGINDAGFVVGFAWNLFQPNDAIQYDSKWSVIGGTDSPWQNAEAMDINNAGHRVGYQAFPSGSWHGAYWEPGANGATDAGLLPGMTVGELYDVNESGIAVGSSYIDFPPFTSRATGFDGKVLRDLNDFLPAGTGAELYEAREINENGDIVGTALVGGLFHAFLLTPMPEWKSVGPALPGSLGAPVLRGFGTLESGSSVELQLSNAPVSASAFVVAGSTQLNLPLLGGILTPTPEFIFPALVTDGKGEATLGLTWPAGVPSGAPTFWQTWVFDPTGPQGFTATAGLTAVAP